MAVSKRTRFEVLRRDNHACRYCGQTAPDVKLTVDHVTPVALGGTDAPSNLVAACVDCNAGKSSSSPDASLVAQVSDDAVRWAAAMSLAAQRAGADRDAEAEAASEFHAYWQTWTFGPKPSHFPLPADWEYAIARQLRSGLTIDDLKYAARVAVTAPRVEYGQEFRYFMGVCRTMLAARVEAAREILNEARRGE